MAKGKASNIADKIKWLLSISIFSVAIVGNGYYTEVAFLYRVLAVVALFILATIILATTVFGKEELFGLQGWKQHKLLWWFLVL